MAHITMAQDTSMKDFVKESQKLTLKELEEFNNILNELEKQKREIHNIQKMEYFLFE